MKLDIIVHQSSAEWSTLVKTTFWLLVSFAGRVIERDLISPRNVTEDFDFFLSSKQSL
jgi:hypothetical protein